MVQAGTPSCRGKRICEDMPAAANKSTMTAAQIQQESLTDAIIRKEGILLINVAASREQQSQATLTQVRWKGFDGIDSRKSTLLKVCKRITLLLSYERQ